MMLENVICSKTSQNFTFEELQEVFYKLIDDFKLLSLKNKDLEKQNQVLTNEKNNFQKEEESFLKENKCLLEENEFLKKGSRKI